MPSASFSWRGRPMRTPLRSPASGSSTGGHVDRGRVVLVAAADEPVEERAVADVLRVTGPTWSRRRGERDDAVARDGAVGRPQADVAAERGRQLDRAAGVGAERPRREPAPRRRLPSRRPSRPGRASGPTGCASARRRSSRSRSPSRTRRCSSCRAGAGRPPCSALRRSRRTPGRSCRGSSSRPSCGRPSSRSRP